MAKLADTEEMYRKTFISTLNVLFYIVLNLNMYLLNISYHTYVSYIYGNGLSSLDCIGSKRSSNQIPTLIGIGTFSYVCWVMQLDLWSSRELKKNKSKIKCSWTCVPELLLQVIYQ